MDWGETATWAGQGLRREVFYFRSEPDDLYGSAYVGDPGTPGIVVVPSWGYEATRLQNLAHSLALDVARAGGSGLLFHYPGHGDSLGEPEGTTLERLITATRDAAGEAIRRTPMSRPVLVGFRLGCAVALLVAEALDLDRLVLVEPALDPSSYFEDLLDRARRMTRDWEHVDGIAFGFPVSEAIRADAEGRGEEVSRALAGFDGRGVLVRYESSPGLDLPAGFDEVIVPGRWHMKSMHHPGFLEALPSWVMGSST